jgi:hypothetical protein
MATTRAWARALAVVLLVGLVGCSASDGTRSPATIRTPTEAPANTPAETSRPTGSLRWEHIVVSADDWAVTALAVGDGQILALVSGELSSVWSSADGRTWDVAHEFAADEYPNDVGWTGDGFVVAGDLGADRTSRVVVDTPQVPVVWTSRDGYNWDRHSVRLESPLNFQRMAVDARGTVVVLGTCSRGKPSEVSYLCGASMDEGTWALADTTQTQAHSVGDVTVGGPGFVAVGMSWPADQPREGAIWMSPDGHAWQQAPATDGLSDVMLTGVAAVDGALVAVGMQIETPLMTPGAWKSEDGQVWSAMTVEGVTPATLTAGGGMFMDVAGLADGTLLAVGGEGGFGTSEVALLLALSTDASTLTRIGDVATAIRREDAGGFGLNTVAALGDGAIIGGGYQGASVWIGER